MAHYANYVGDLAIGHIVATYEDTTHYCVLEDRRIPCSTEKVARENVAYYLAQGEKAEYSVETATLNSIEVW